MRFEPKLLGVLLSIFVGIAPAMAQDPIGPEDPNAKPVAPLTPPEEQVLEDFRPDAATLAKLSGYYSKTRSMQARFTQRNEDGSILRGRVSLERPGRIRFEYDRGTDLLVVADGRVLSVVDYEINEVTRWPINDTPLRLLLSDKLDLKGYRAQILPAPSGVANVFLVRAVDPNRPDMGEMIARFREDDEQITLLGWRITDTAGFTTFVDLDSHQRNIPLSKALWTFKDPRGLSRRKNRRR